MLRAFVFIFCKLCLYLLSIFTSFLGLSLSMYKILYILK